LSMGKRLTAWLVMAFSSCPGAISFTRELLLHPPAHHSTPRPVWPSSSNKPPKPTISPGTAKRAIIERRQFERCCGKRRPRLTEASKLVAVLEKKIMTKVEAVIQNSKVEAVKSALQEIGVEGMTVIEVRGHGRQKGHTEVYRGREYSVDLIPKTKLEVVLPDPMVEKAVQAILGAARSGKIGDGKIFLSRVDEAIRIRNDERGEGAL
jgi:nitrogen regulatory protein P-II 1